MAEKNIAVLDESMRLVGYRRGEPGRQDVVVPDDCDLPTNGLYVWDAGAKQFRPLGHGHPKISARPPISTERAIARLIEAMAKIETATGAAILSADLKEWLDWYQEHLNGREEEAYVARRIRRGEGRR